MKKVCKHCKKKYKKQARVVTVFGSTFCLHDDKLENYEKLSGMPMRSDPGIKAEVALWGHGAAEQRYIDKAHKRGNAVVRGSDGLLREIGQKKK